MIHTYSIAGMTCSKCLAKVKSELLKMGDIAAVELQLESPQATITMSRHIPTASLQEAIGRAGEYHIAEYGGVMNHTQEHAETKDKGSSYFPVFLIFAYITGVTLLIQWGNGSFDGMQWMRHFMAGFFLVFSFFKLMNLKGFAEGYRSYDLIARLFPAWGFIYPFIELALGILYLAGLFVQGTTIATFIVMGISSVAVVQSLLKKKPFQCACLGTVIQLPLSTVTLVEDGLMVAMSAFMFIYSQG